MTTKRRLAAVLAIATLALAASTLHFAHELRLERARTEQGSVVAPQAAPVRVEAPLPVPDTAPAAAESVHTEATLQLPSQPIRGLALDTARVAEIKAAFAPMMQEQMAYAGLNAYESDRLLDLTAEAMVRGQASSRECRSTPGCDIRALQTVARESLQQELERTLGADKLQRLYTYDELQRIKSFRSEIPAGLELSETAATQLGTALAQERYRRVDKAESASVFNQRLYDRAAGILTAEQLAFFQQRQESTFGRD